MPDDFIRIFQCCITQKNAVPLLQLTATYNKQKHTINTCLENITTDVEAKVLSTGTKQQQCEKTFSVSFPRFRSEPALYDHSDSTLVCSYALVLCFDWLVKYRKFFGKLPKVTAMDGSAQSRSQVQLSLTFMYIIHRGCKV